MLLFVIVQQRTESELQLEEQKCIVETVRAEKAMVSGERETSLLRIGGPPGTGTDCSRVSECVFAVDEAMLARAR